MAILVESYKRLYQNGKIEEAYLVIKLDEGIISQEEYDYILNE